MSQVVFYDRLNNLMEFIDSHLSEKINLPELAQRSGTSFGTLERVFPLLSGMSLAEYIRKRRLTLAARDLAQSNLRVIDVATKYGYDSAVAFSRSFEKFHGVKPSEVKLHISELRFCPQLVFTPPEQQSELKYEIVELPSLTLSGISIKTNNAKISHDAPELFRQVAQIYPSLPDPDYGLVHYGGGRDDDANYIYWVLWKQNLPEFKKYHIPAARWLKFEIPSQNEREIQSTSHWFYENFLPTCSYKLSSAPDLEYYHDGVTDLLIPID